MEFFSGLNFWLVFILISIPAIFLGIREKKSKFTHIINNICDI